MTGRGDDAISLRADRVAGIGKGEPSMGIARCMMALLATACLIRPIVHAQQLDTARLDPVVVTAERVPTARSTSSATTTVITGEELAERGIRRVAHALRVVAGIAVVETGSMGGATAVFVRGGESDYVKVLVDGVPVNDPGGAIDLADYTTDNVERIEIVRGPVSVLYGSDAVSGVVQIFTRRGEGAARGNLDFRVGSHSALEASAEVAGGAGAVGYTVAASHARTDGIYDLNNQYRRVVVSGQVTAAPDRHTSTRLSVNLSRSRYHFPTDGAGQVADRNSFQQRERIVGALEVRRKITPALEARLALGLHDSDGAIDDQPDGAADTLGFYGFSTDRGVGRRTAELELNARPSGATVITAGVQLEHEKEQSSSTSLSEFGESQSAFDAQRRNVGLFLQIHTGEIRWISVTAGVRVDDSDAFGTFLSARAGASIRVGAASRIRTSVGRAFKAPTFYESFADDPFARGNPALRPEKSLMWEVGLEHRLLRDRVSVSGTYFAQRFRDLIQYTSASPNRDDPTYFNVAAADARGIELEAAGSLDVGLQVKGAYTYVETEVLDAGFDTDMGAAFVEGARLLRRPAHLLTLSMTQHVGPRATLSADLRYVGSRADRDFSVFPAAPVELNSYATVDFAARVTVWSARGGRRGLVLTARVANLFDVEYEQVFGFLTPGRTFTVGAGVGW